MSDGDYPVEGLPTPAASMEPATVVDTQLSALSTNDEPFEDAGVLTAYNFASPSNRRATGPRDRFVRMVHGPQYSPMIDHEEAVTGPVEREEGVARQRVTLTGPTGRTVTYRFRLVRQSTGQFRNCWTTAGVLVD
ncbi:DUF4864 domain-containing protein [Halobaculum sp. MBLA0143]|uniref:DUF4864 domain-containing protein n=1 Tax=Halobaculum sp. MBLA0143 TaxID=3079933 RepID=UPI0035266450